jgi:hypothetical protein
MFPPATPASLPRHPAYCALIETKIGQIEIEQEHRNREGGVDEKSSCES